MRELGASAGEGRTADEACTLAAQTLASYVADVPFALTKKYSLSWPLDIDEQRGPWTAEEAERDLREQEGDI